MGSLMAATSKIGRGEDTFPMANSATAEPKKLTFHERRRELHSTPKDPSPKGRLPLVEHVPTDWADSDRFSLP